VIVQSPSNFGYDRFAWRGQVLVKQQKGCLPNEWGLSLEKVPIVTATYAIVGEFDLTKLH